MVRIPNGQYTKEFREEAVKMATRRYVHTGDFKAFIFTEIDFRELDKGFKTGNIGEIGKRQPPVPQGIWDQLESVFVERRPYGQNTNVFTEHARASNGLRVRLFKMAIEETRNGGSPLLSFSVKSKNGVWSMAGRRVNPVIPISHPVNLGRPRSPDFAP